MVFDIVYVTYNSNKWVEQCFNSLHKCDYPKEKINIIVVDNYSTDNTVKKLKEIKSTVGTEFASFNIIESGCNLGFGLGNNLGFKQGKSEIVCFFNIDTEVMEDTLQQLSIEIANSTSEVGMWELRQFPYEHPKIYNPITGYTSWCSGAAFAVRRNIFDAVNGFDKNIFLYAEDVDLSWRIKATGYKLKYLPKVTIFHYSYEEKGKSKPNQYINSLINNFNLRLKFGSIKDIFVGIKNLLRVLMAPSYFKGAKNQVIKKFGYNLCKLPAFCLWRFKNEKVQAKFYNWEYEQMRDGAFYENKLPTTTPLVSILIRTCGRYELLREALISVRNQTYPNIEIIVIEDGADLSKENLKAEFSDLKISYQSTGKKVGRSKVGNIAIELAQGEYLNFLDDDDVLYADHVEVLVNKLEASKGNIAYTNAFEVKMQENEKFTEDKINEYKVVYSQPFNRVKLFYENYLPIQCVMFRKNILEGKIWLDEKMDALEDWDFWIQLACKSKFEFIHKTTSIYRIPMNVTKRDERQRQLDDALDILRKKQKAYYVTHSVTEMVENTIELMNQNGVMKLKSKLPRIYKLYKLVKKIER